MMNRDAEIAQLLLTDMLREAENRRQHNQLLREADANNQRHNVKRGAIERLIAHLHAQKPLETGEAHRVHAV